MKTEMLQAAGLIAEGQSAAEVARRLGKSESTIRRWMKDETARGAYREAILRTAQVGFAKAVNRLEKQVDSRDETISHRASRDMIDRFGSTVMQEDDHEVVVRVVGAPVIGMPQDVGT